MMTPAPAFGYWEDGNTRIAVNPDPPTPEEAEPFVVCARSDAVVPINVMVFARDHEHARQRVLLALRECAEKDYGGHKGARPDKWWSRPNRAVALLKGIDSGKYTVTVTRADIASMSRVAWASNDTVCG